ncbi:netrin receptor DCC-like [Clavelina lepadiformis]|uniref:netrin receptor DCC-like n=1 Tax=Clavelina lepadiformis TaxID=159417 RepID=UPI004041CD39
MKFECFFLAFHFVSIFICKSGLSIASSISNSGIISKTYLDFYYQPEDVIAVKRQHIILNCLVGLFYPNAKASEQNQEIYANITWFKNDQVLSLGGILSSRTSLKNGSLLIQSASFSDSGLYRCKAKYDSVALLSHNAHVTVAVFNSYPNQLQSTSKNIGLCIRFNCSFGNANPPPLITWFKDGKDIGNTNSWKTLARNSSSKPVGSLHGQSFSSAAVLPNGALEIASLSPHDSGQYFCLGTNAANTRRSDKFSLHVLKGVASRESLYFVAQPVATTVVVGDAAFFECAVSGYPDVFVKWLKNNTEVHFGLSPRMRLYGGNNLVIDNTTLDDEGEYSCIVEEANPPLISTAKLLLLVPPYITIKANNLYEVYVGCQLKIPCSMSGFPQPVISVYKDGAPLVVSNSTKLQNDALHLKIESIKNGGIYQWFGVNEVGFVQFTTNLHVLSQGNVTLESAPVDNKLYLVDLTFNHARISWKRLGSLSATGYKIQVFDNTNDSFTTLTTTVTQIDLEHLEAGHTMRIIVEPFTPLCHGSPSKELIFTVPTAKSITAGVVQNFAVEPISSDSLSVTWKPPSDTKNLQYLYKLVIEEMELEDEKEITQEKTKHQFRNLKKYTLYGVKVAVVDEDGMIGPFSSQIVVRTPEAEPTLPPHNITAVAESSDTAIVRWFPPPLSSVNGIIQGYKIRYRDMRSKKNSVMIAQPNATHFFLKGLRRNAEYAVKMQVYNGEGSSPFSRRVYFDTPKKERLEFGPPGKLQLTEPQRFANEIVVSWFPPDGNVYVRDYIISWGKTTPHENTAKIDSKQNSYRITNLDPSTQYYISVRAGNLAGVGMESLKPVRTKTAEDVLDELFPPLALHIDVLTHTTLNVSWHDTDKKKRSRYYLVRCKTNVAGEPRVREINATETDCLIHGLRPHTLYEVAVKAIEGNRRSSWSMTEKASTLESKPSSAPTDLTVMPMEEEKNRVMLSWQPPLEPNGELTGYLVFYTTNERHDISKWVIDTVDGNRMSTTIDNLTLDTKYYFKVLASNREGSGPYSEIVEYTTPNPDKTEIGPTGSSSMPTFMWYLIIGGIGLLVLSALTVATLLICRNFGAPKQSKKHRKTSGTNHQTSNGVNGVHRTNGKAMISPDSWARGGPNSINSTSMRLLNPEEQIEMRSLNNMTGRFTEDGPSVFYDYHCAHPQEALPLTVMTDIDAAPYYHSYPYPSRHSNLNDVLRSPVSSNVHQRMYSSKDEYDTNTLQLPPLSPSPYEIPHPTHYGIESRYTAVPSSPRDYAGDSAYGSDHPPLHPVDDISTTLTNPQFDSLSHGKRPYYCRDEARKFQSGQSSPVAGSVDSARHSRTTSVDTDDAKLANVVEFVRDMRAAPVDHGRERRSVEALT